MLEEIVMRSLTLVFLGLALGLGAMGCPNGGQGEPELVYTEQREVCADRNPTRNLYWGDLHAHTGMSFDAWAYGNHHRPDDLYAFAKGETRTLPLAIYTLLQTPGGEALAARLGLLSALLAVAALVVGQWIARRGRIPAEVP